MQTGSNTVAELWCIVPSTASQKKLQKFQPKSCSKNISEIDKRHCHDSEFNYEKKEQRTNIFFKPPIPRFLDINN